MKDSLIFDQVIFSIINLNRNDLKFNRYWSFNKIDNKNKINIIKKFPKGIFIFLKVKTDSFTGLILLLKKNETLKFLVYLALSHTWIFDISQTRGSRSTNSYLCKWLFAQLLFFICFKCNQNLIGNVSHWKTQYKYCKFIDFIF